MSLLKCISVRLYFFDRIKTFYKFSSINNNSVTIQLYSWMYHENVYYSWVCIGKCKLKMLVCYIECRNCDAKIWVKHYCIILLKKKRETEHHFCTIVYNQLRVISTAFSHRSVSNQLMNRFYTWYCCEYFFFLPWVRLLSTLPFWRLQGMGGPAVPLGPRNGVSGSVIAMPRDSGMGMSVRRTHRASLAH